MSDSNKHHLIEQLKEIGCSETLVEELKDKDKYNSNLKSEMDCDRSSSENNIAELKNRQDGTMIKTSDTDTMDSEKDIVEKDKKIEGSLKAMDHSLGVESEMSSKENKERDNDGMSSKKPDREFYEKMNQQSLSWKEECFAVLENGLQNEVGMHLFQVKEASIIMNEAIRNPEMIKHSKNLSKDTLNRARKLFEVLKVTFPTVDSSLNCEDIQEIQSEYGDATEDSNKYDEEEHDETSIKELYSDVSCEDSGDSYLFCRDALVMQEKAFTKKYMAAQHSSADVIVINHDCQRDDMSKHLVKNDENDLKRSVNLPYGENNSLRVKEDKNDSLVDEKGQDDMKKVEKPTLPGFVDSNLTAEGADVSFTSQVCDEERCFAEALKGFNTEAPEGKKVSADVITSWGSGFLNSSSLESCSLGVKEDKDDSSEKEKGKRRDMSWSQMPSLQTHLDSIDAVKDIKVSVTPDQVIDKTKGHNEEHLEESSMVAQGYKGDYNFSEDLKSFPIHFPETTTSFERESTNSYYIKSCSLEGDECFQRKELSQLFSQHWDEASKTSCSLNKLSGERPTVEWFCFQNNIVLDSLYLHCGIGNLSIAPTNLTTLEFNFLNCSVVTKCKSKNVYPSCLSFTKSGRSNSCNFSVQAIIDLEGSEAASFQNSSACLPSPQRVCLKEDEEGKKFDKPKTNYETLHSGVVVKETVHDKEKQQSSIFAQEYKPLSASAKFSVKKRGRRRHIPRSKQRKRGRNASQLGLKHENNRCGAKKGDGFKETKQRKGMKEFLQYEGKELSNTSNSGLRGQRVDKFRKHTGAKGRGGGGGRPPDRGGRTGHQSSSSRSPGGAQGSGANNQGFGSGGDDPDNNKRGKREGYGSEISSVEDENGDDDEGENSEKKKDGNIHRHYNRHVNNRKTSHTMGISNTPNMEGNRNNIYSDTLPSLPRPIWDASTLRERQVKENLFKDARLNRWSPDSTKMDWQDHRRESAPELTIGTSVTSGHLALTESMPVPSSAPVPCIATGDGQDRAEREDRKHGVISVSQLCAIIGYATISASVPTKLFEKFDICLTKVMHDLSFGQQELMPVGGSQLAGTSTNTLAKIETGTVDSAAHGTASSKSAPLSHVTATAATAKNRVKQPPEREETAEDASECISSPLACTVCLVVSGLLTHLSHHRENVCVQCAQILNLMTQHTHSCVAKRRPQQRITSSDLCYKICKKGGWCTENINCNSAAFKGKIQKYCDKAICKSTKRPTSPHEFDAFPSFGIGEMESLRGPDALSSGVNSSPSLSFSGNPVALESGTSLSDKSSQSKLGRDIDAVVSSASEGGSRNNSLSSAPFTLNQSVGPSVGQPTAAAVSAANISGKIHRGVVRKGSYRSPTIQPIVEVSTAAEEGLAVTEGQSSENDANIRDLIYRRYGPKGTDPYDTQPTFGDKKGYESMPQGNLHDQEQFYSFGNRAVGVPGIGEVVFGNKKQLKLVAGFWETKREDCERTRTAPPYQHREEGVILSQYKAHFSILRTRYQKHHQWERVAHLGNGMSGKCHLVTDLNTEFKFCCKKVHLLKYTKEEVNIWSDLEHAFIVKLYGAIRHGVKVYIFCEFIDGGSLASCIEEQKRLGQRFSHWAAINYFHQLLKALAYLQSKDVLHEDIKADNILLRNGCTYIALTDFGTCRRLCDPKELLHKSPVGSAAHWSPEKAASQGHGFPSDLWAAVCVLIHMLSGDPPWIRRFMTSATILNFIIYSREPPLEDVPPNVQPMVRNLIASGLVKDADKRPNAESLLGHEAFRILKNIQPDRFYSSLGGQSQVAFLPKTNDEKASQVLYSTEISTGPYQESAGPSENSEVQRKNATSERDALADANDEQELTEPQNVHDEDREEKEEDISEGRNENIPKRLNEASSRLLELCNIAQVADHEPKENLSGSEKEPRDIPDLNALLLCVPDENKAFYNDDVPDGTEALKQSTAKQQQLEVFKPEERTAAQLPNLSIFGMDLSDGNSQGLRSALSSANLVENARDAFFILSLESEDFTSADLFDQGSIADTETIRYSSSAHDTETETPVTPTNISHVSGAGSSPQNDHHTSVSHLQKRKPDHLKLNVSPTSSMSNLPALGERIGNGSGSNEGEPGTASSGTSWRGSQTHRTPSSSGRLCGSGISGSRTSTSPFPFKIPDSSSLLDEQDKLVQKFRAEQESLSSSGSEFLNDFLGEDPGPTQADKAQNRIANGDWQSVLGRLQENIEISSLEGHGMLFYDENSMEIVLPARYSEKPVNKRQLVENISGRLSMQYGHFMLIHMNKSPLNFDTPLEAQGLLVRQLSERQKDCLCDGCRSQF